MYALVIPDCLNVGIKDGEVGSRNRDIFKFQKVVVGRFLKCLVGFGLVFAWLLGTLELKKKKVLLGLFTKAQLFHAILAEFCGSCLPPKQRNNNPYLYAYKLCLRLVLHVHVYL